MSFPVSRYIDEMERCLYVAGTGVSLDSVVIGFREGESPQEIVKALPTLELWQVYGAIAYYLENREVVDTYVEEGMREFERAPKLSDTHPELYARLQAARQELRSKQS